MMRFSASGFSSLLKTTSEKPQAATAASAAQTTRA
jgi:hypothetical protein